MPYGKGTSKIIDVNVSGVVSTRLDTFDTQLTDNTQAVERNRNSDFPLQIINPYMTIQNIHPKVLHFDTAWNGFNYWMAYTPYSFGRPQEENPCIVASNDGINWEVPTGLTNPLEVFGGDYDKYNNDTHLVFRTDLNRLEIWWRFAETDTLTATIYRRTSTDGVTWNTKEIMHTGTLETDDFISPAPLYEDGLYKMWHVRKISGVWELCYSDSSDGLTWTPAQIVGIDFGTLTPWHLDVIHSDIGYEFVIQAYEVGGSNNTANLYYVQSSDLVSYTQPKLILSPSQRLGAFDEVGIYRSSILKINGIYYIYYSSVGKNNIRGMSISHGKNIEYLRGINYQPGQDKKTERYINLNDGTQNVPADVKKGTIRFNGATNNHEMYSGVKWLSGLSTTRLLVEKTSSQPLTSAQFSDVTFQRLVFTDDNFANEKTYTVPNNGLYKVSFGIQYNLLADGDEIEVGLHVNGAYVRLLSRAKTKGGVFFANGSSIVKLTSNDQVVIKAKYTGTGSSVILTQYQANNFLTIEKV